jgi:large subunit ribosomal protein L31
MKEGIHPSYFPEATVICACGNSWHTGSTVEVIHTDVCSKCHPFFTGEQRIVDTEGQVERFYKKLQARQDFIEAEKDRKEARTSPELPIGELELSTRAVQALAKANITIVGQVLERLEKGDAGLLKVDGFGRKSLADLKRSLKRRGYKLPEAGTEPQES